MAAGLSISKFAFCDLALESALQLELAKAGKEWDRVPPKRLSDVLIRAARPSDAESRASFIEAGYYEPFERLLSRREGTPQSIQDIKSYFGAAAESLKSLDAAPSTDRLKELVDFCVNLHKELARELAREDAIGARQWPVTDIPT
jgi:hypothetical protein